MGLHLLIVIISSFTDNKLTGWNFEQDEPPWLEVSRYNLPFYFFV